MTDYNNINLNPDQQLTIWYHLLPFAVILHPK
jgi:hypothetical protein